MIVQFLSRASVDSVFEDRYLDLGIWRLSIRENPDDAWSYQRDLTKHRPGLNPD